MFQTHVVKSNILLLWSRPATSRTRTILDLTRNLAKVLGVMVHLNLTAIRHYALDILPKGEEKAEECPKDPKDIKATLFQLNQQFGHLRLDMMMGLLKKVNCGDKEARDIVTNIHEQCATCNSFLPMPVRPVVSLPWCNLNAQTQGGESGPKSLSST